MKVFENMEQRIIYMYIELFPSFKPDKNFNEISQKQFYDFIRSIFLKFYESPSLLFSKLNPDDFFMCRHNKKSENKQKTYDTMRKIGITIGKFSNFLYDIGKAGNMNNGSLVVGNSYKIPKNYIIILKQCGLDYQKNGVENIFQHKEYNELFSCWKWFSMKSGVDVLHFIFCMFDNDYFYASEIFSKIIKDENQYKKLEKYFLDNNYTRICCHDKRLNLNYYKEYDKKENELKWAWGNRTLGGISVEYDPMMKNPVLLSLRIPYYKILLERFDEMPDDVKNFVKNTGKKCDTCRYCIQMDKTGEKPYQFIMIDDENKMCQYFPAFQYCWEYLDEGIVKNIIGLLRFANGILKNV